MDNLTTVAGNHTECWQQPARTYFSKNLEALNRQYKAMTPTERIAAFYKCVQNENGENNVLMTSSFGTTAVYLLHLYYDLGIRQKVYFLDTTYHFEETLAYKAQLTRLFDLEIAELKPEEWKNKFTRENEVWKTDPDLCCSVNKVEPLQSIKAEADFWISGLMSWQNDNRQNKEIFEEKDGVIKFYPILDVTEAEALQYIEENQLPVHPLKPLGYESIGCKHCTFKGKGRAGRWIDTVKTECGLHR